MPSTVKLHHHQDNPAARLRSADAQFWVLIAFMVIVFATGGGARPDILSLVVLRPLSFLVVGYALLLMPKGMRRKGLMPLMLLLVLAGIMGLQLMPLPPGVWMRLPGRSLIAAIENDVGIVHGWRPLSLSPSRTLNSLFSLGVPLATSLLLIGVERKRQGSITWLLLAAGLVSTVLGLLQMIGPSHSALYAYRITNFGMPTGLFANRNHQAVFLACLYPLLAHHLIQLRNQETARRPMILAVLLAAAIVFLVLIVATGSRAGTALALTALLGSAALWLIARRGQPRGPALIDRFILPAGLLMAAALLALLFLNSRTQGIDRIFRESLTGELRWQILPVLSELAKTYFPFGSGFGSFYLVYQVAEPHALLQESYLNQAHNDLLQFIIEGGLPALVLLIAALTWFARAGWLCWLRFCRAADEGSQKLPLGPFAWLSLAVLLAASVVDYPLRTPAIMVPGIILAHLVARSALSTRFAAATNGD